MKNDIYLKELKQKAISTAYATELGFNNISKGILYLNSTNEQPILKYALEKLNASNKTNLDIKFKTNLSNLEGILNDTSFLGVKLARNALDYMEKENINQDIEELIFEFIIKSNYIDRKKLLEKLNLFENNFN